MPREIGPVSSSVFLNSLNRHSASTLFTALPWKDLPDSTVSLFQVFSSKESSDEDPPQPFPQPSSTKGGRQVRSGPWPALKSRQSVVALNSAALVASRTRAFQEQGEAGCVSTPRHQKIVRQASVDSSGEEGEA